MSLKSFSVVTRLGIIIALLVSVFGIVTPVSAATLEVDPGDCAGVKFCTIQDALNNANNGDVINIVAGTFNESLNLADPNLTITGAGAGNTTIVGTGGYGITSMGHNGLTINDLTLNNAAGTYGFKISNTDGFTLQNVAVVNSGRSGVDLNGVDNALIENVSVTGTVSGVGISLTDCNNVTLRNIITSGNAWGGIAIYTWGRYYPPAASNNISLEGTNSLGESAPVYIEVGNFGDPANPGPVTALNLTGFGYVVHNTTDQPNHFYFQPTLAAANAVAAGFPTPLASHVWVNSTAGQLGPWNSIQQAIDNATAGDTINLGPGLWDESVTIDKAITLNGVGSDSTELDNTIVGSAAAPAVFSLEASVINIFAMQIQPNDVPGLRVPDGSSVSGLALNDVKIVGQGTTPVPSESENGLEVRTTGSINNLTITNAVFANLDYGWYFYKHNDWGPGGSNVSNVSVTDSSFLRNKHKGIYVEKLSDATFTRVNVIGNGWDPSFWNRRWDAGFDINLKGRETYQNIVFNDVTFIDNGLGAQDGMGLMVKARDDGGTYGANPAALNTVTVNGCYVEGNERGIRFGEPGRANNTPTNVTVADCVIENNVQTYSGGPSSAVGGYINETVPVQTATNNWWGDASGPSGDGPGTGDVLTAIGGTVNFTPWRTVPPAYLMGEMLDASGGTVTTNNFTFTFPAGILPEYAFANFQFTGFDGSGPGPAGMTKLDPTFNLQVHQTDGTQWTSFTSPFQVCYQYTAADLAVISDPATYTFAARPERSTTWEYLTTSHNAGTQTICASLDHLSDFAIVGGSGTIPSGDDDDSAATVLPATGFAPDVYTPLPEQPAEMAYDSTSMMLEIPDLGVQMSIVGISQQGEGWDVSWLGGQAGYLQGTAFPTWAGNTVLTAHVFNNDGLAGPFSQLNTLGYGDQIKIQAWGQTYTYEVRESKLVAPRNVKKIFQHEEYDVVTLLTCEFYNPLSGEYFLRRAVRAVLVDVQ